MFETSEKGSCGCSCQKNLKTELHTKAHEYDVHKIFKTPLTRQATSSDCVIQSRRDINKAFAGYPGHAIPDPGDQPPRLLPGGGCHAQVMCSNDCGHEPLLLQTGEVPSTAAEQAGAAD